MLLIVLEFEEREEWCFAYEVEEKDLHHLEMMKIDPFCFLDLVD
jgi:hypothetical protein